MGTPQNCRISVKFSVDLLFYFPGFGFTKSPKMDMICATMTVCLTKTLSKSSKISIFWFFEPFCLFSSVPIDFPCISHNCGFPEKFSDPNSSQKYVFWHKKVENWWKITVPTLHQKLDFFESKCTKSRKIQKISSWNFRSKSRILRNVLGIGLELNNTLTWRKQIPLH